MILDKIKIPVLKPATKRSIRRSAVKKRIPDLNGLTGQHSWHGRAYICVEADCRKLFERDYIP